jgi:hypothetical protein
MLKSKDPEDVNKPMPLKSIFTMLVGIPRCARN